MNKITKAGHDAMRAVLLAAVERSDWNLTRAAVALGVSGPSSVIRSLQSLAPVEYARARADGRITQAWNKGTRRRTGDTAP